MDYIGKFFSNFKEFYNEINSATLTGAIDVIVIEQPDGTYCSSPFHVRFGKMGVLRTKEKIVDIEVNGEPVDIHMKLGDTGEAFFVEEVENENEEENIPFHLATSPIPNDIDANYVKKNLDKLKQNIRDQESGDASNRSINKSIEDIDENINMLKASPSSDNNSLMYLNQSRLSLEDKEALKCELSKVGPFFRSIAIQTGECNEDKIKDTKKRRRKKLSSHKKLRMTESHEDNEELFQMDDDWDDDKTIVAGSGSMSRSSSAPTPSLLTNKVSKQHFTSLIDFHPFSDGEITTCSSPEFSRPSTPKSDTEFEILRNDAQSQTEADDISWEWGELPQFQKRASLSQHNSPSFKQDMIDNSVININPESTEMNHDSKKSVLGEVFKFIKTKEGDRKEDEKGIYLDELNPHDIDPEVADLYFPKLKSSIPLKRAVKDDDSESGNGTSLPHSPQLTNSGPVSLDSDSDQDRMSNSGEGVSRLFKDVSMSLCGGLEDDTVSLHKFYQSIVTYDNFCANPLNILQNPSLVFQMDGRYYNWATAAPILMSIILFQRPLSISSIESLIEQTMPKKKQKYKSSWWSWGRSTSKIQIVREPIAKDDLIEEERINGTVSVGINIENRENSTFISKDDIEDVESIVIKSANTERSPHVQYRKVLRISSDQIESLNLIEGRNEVVFSVTTAYQGTTRCKCHIYLWRYDDKIVISDIDGTITKSDLLGHILPVIGKDWAQSGVANLFNKIQKNGYKLLYLSSRAIGQAKITRDYLRSIKQGDLCLPDGPLLLSPTSLISAFHREVIEKKPETFKISCLKDIKALFPTNPFYAGFGNRINDTWAYRAIDIPLSRIFTINHRGELKLALIQSFNSSYTRLSDVVDQVFPLIQKSSAKSEFLSEYSSFNYWRDPIPIVNDDKTISYNGQ